MTEYIIPLFICIILLIALLKKLPSYDIFTKGAEEAIDLSIKTFPFLAAIFIMIELLNVSNILQFITTKTELFWNFLGIPTQVVELILLRPLTGSGSLATLTEIYTRFGTNSYISNCASIIAGSSDTLFYILAVYFGNTSIKKTGAIIPIALISCFIGNIIACLLCRFI